MEVGLGDGMEIVAEQKKDALHQEMMSKRLKIIFVSTCKMGKVLLPKWAISCVFKNLSGATKYCMLNKGIVASR
jgi:hypothetical protein